MAAETDRAGPSQQEQQLEHALQLEHLRLELVRPLTKSSSRDPRGSMHTSASRRRVPSTARVHPTDACLAWLQQPLTLSALKKRALALGIPRKGVDMVDDTVPTQPPYTFESTRIEYIISDSDVPR